MKKKNLIIKVHHLAPVQLPSVNEVESLLWVAYPPCGGSAHAMCQQSSTGLRLEGVGLFTLVVVWTDEVSQVDTGPCCERMRYYCVCVCVCEREFAKAVLTEGPLGCSGGHLHMQYSSPSLSPTQRYLLNKKHKMWINAIISNIITVFLMSFNPEKVYKCQSWVTDLFRTFKIKVCIKKNEFTGTDAWYSSFIWEMKSPTREQNILRDPQEENIVLFP